MSKYPVCVIPRREPQLKDSFLLYIIGNKKNFILGIIAIVVIPPLLVWMNLGEKDNLINILIIVLYILGGLLLLTFLFSFVVMPLLAHNTAKKIDIEKSSTAIYDDCVHCTIVIDGQEVVDKDIHYYECRQIEEHKDFFMLRTVLPNRKNFMILIRKENLNQAGLETLHKYITNVK